MLMAAQIDELDLESRVEPEVEADATWLEVARCNDRAHGILEDWSMAAVFDAIEDDATHRYVIQSDGEPVSGLLAREQDGDCYFWFVATVPEAQRRGLSSELMRVALRAARERGCVTATLESTRMAEAMYERLGFRPLGRYQMWERRTG
jgi:ribosomal protein S18 acetylase RimI-like enzyme